MAVGAILLTSAARTASTTTADQFTSIPDDADGIYLILDITATPNNAETLTPSIQIKDPASNKYVAVTAFSASKTGTELGANPTEATLVYLLYPAGVATAAAAGVSVQGLATPAIWRAKITHSSTGSWTYTLSLQTAQ